MREVDLSALALRLRARHALLVAAGTFLGVKLLRIGRWLVYGSGRWLWWTPKGITLPPIVPVSRFHSFRHISVQRQFPLYQYQYFKQYGPVIRIPLFQLAPWVFVCDPSVAKLVTEGDRSLVLEESPKAPWLYSLFSSFTGGPNMFSRPLTTQGSIPGCLASRKAVASAFSMAQMDGIIPHLNKYMESLGEVLDRMASSERDLDACELFLRLSLDFTCGSLFDFKSDSMRDLTREGGAERESMGKSFLESVNTIVNEISVMRVTNPLRKYMWWAEHQKKFDRSGLFLRELGRDIVNKYRASHTDEELARDCSVLGHLMRSPYPSDKERIADIIIFLIAGHDTTGYTLAWIVIEVAKKPEIARKIREELDKANPERKHFTRAQLSSLVYLNWVIKEGLRLWPVAATSAIRLAQKDIPCPGGLTIPAGSTVSVSNFAMHRSGITRPDEFVPERWDEKSEDHERLKTIYRPFSTGMRRCVGENLAMVELRLILATLLQRYEWENLMEPRPQFYLTTKPEGAVVRMRMRA